jgi:hypothetical protein
VYTYRSINGDTWKLAGGRRSQPCRKGTVACILCISPGSESTLGEV